MSRLKLRFCIVHTYSTLHVHMVAPAAPPISRDRSGCQGRIKQDEESDKFILALNT